MKKLTNNKFLIEFQLTVMYGPELTKKAMATEPPVAESNGQICKWAYKIFSCLRQTEHRLIFVHLKKAFSEFAIFLNVVTHKVSASRLPAISPTDPLTHSTAVNTQFLCASKNTLPKEFRAMKGKQIIFHQTYT